MDELQTTMASRTERGTPQEAVAPQRSWRGLLVDYLVLLALAGAIIALDQWTKALVRASLQIGEAWVPLEALPFLRVVNWHNTGAAFGLFRNYGDVFTVLAVVVAGVILYYFPQVPRSDWPLRLAMGFQLGGAVGNLVDRLTRGRVTDFISVWGFPVFNVADASIFIGVVVLVVGVWWKDQKLTSPPMGEDGGASPPASEAVGPLGTALDPLAENRVENEAEVGHAGAAVEGDRGE